MRVAYREKREGRYVLSVVEVAVRDVVWDGERFVLKEVRDVVVPEFEQDDNSLRTLRRLGEKYDAVILEDDEAVEATLSGLDDDFSIELLTRGFDADAVAEMSRAERETLVEDGATPEPPTVDEPPKKRRRRKKRRKKKRATAPSTPPEEPARPVEAKEVTTYRLLVSRPEWPECHDENGEPIARRYDCGGTTCRETAERAREAWSLAGFDTNVRTGRRDYDVRRCDDSLALEPFEPIVCLVPNCPWVGINLPSHLTKHGMTTDGYVEAFRYDGPTMASRARRAIEKMHRYVRRKASIRVGIFLVEVRGDRDLDVWRLDGITGVDAYDVTWIAGTGGRRGDETLDAKTFFERMRPVSTFPKTLVEKKLREARDG